MAGCIVYSPFDLVNLAFGFKFLVAGGNHQVSMEDGDHSMCSIELLACPEHREEQLREMDIFCSKDLPHGEEALESTMFIDRDGKPIVGFCLWCDKDFYSMSEVEEHNADNSKACPVFQQFKDGN